MTLLNCLCWRLIVSERDERIDAYRTPCRYVTSEKSDADEKNSDTRKCERVRRPDAVKQSRHQVRNDQRTNKSYRSAGNGQPQSLTQNHSQDVAALRAEREANADVVRALADNVGNHSVNSKSSKQQGRQCEQANHFQRKSPLGERRGHHVVQHLRAKNGKFGIDQLHLLAQLYGSSGGVQASAQEYRQIFRPVLIQAQIDLRNARFGE